MSEPVESFPDRNGIFDADRVARVSRPTPDPLMGSTASTFKDQANQAAQEAKSTVVALADEARLRLADIVEHQKSIGADQIAGVARAAKAAAVNLDGSSPQLSKLLLSAADRVDSVADDIRNRDLADVVSTISAFGRRQPVAFFGGAVVVGFLLARFLKSDVPTVGISPGTEPMTN